MSQNQYKTPKTGGVTKIKESFTSHRKRHPSKALLEILKKKPSQKHKQSGSYRMLVVQNLVALAY